MQKLSETNIDTSKSLAPKLSALYRFFCWCSGSRLYLLKQCPTEYNKFYGIGVIVFMTGVLASLSGGYAMHTVFQRPEISIAFGILWGFLIFSIDWYIVASLRKQQKRFSEFGMAMPRFVLAILIAFVISMPLKMKLFEREIEQQILFDQQQSTIKYGSMVSNEFSDIERLELSNAMLREEISRKEEHRNMLFSMIVAEAEGMSPTRTPGKGSVYREKKQEYDKVDDELKQLRAQNVPIIQQNNDGLAKLRNRRDQALSEAQVVTKKANGFLARLQAMNALTESSKSIQYASWFIILLFMTIESSPIIVKLLSSRGPYDDLLEAEEYIKQVEIRRNVVQAELTEDHQIDLHRLLEKERNERLFEVEKDHIQKEAEVLAQINKMKIEKWKEEEISKLEASGSHNNLASGDEKDKGEEASKLFEPELSLEKKDLDFEENEPVANEILSDPEDNLLGNLN